MSITIDDDFDLRKIAESGQCFRVQMLEDKTFRFVFGAHVLYITPLANQQFQVSCSQGDWREIWRPYFDLDRSYRTIRTSIPHGEAFLRRAADEAAGLRILRQDPFEMLVTFILSQRKSIPAIRDCVEALCAAYGSPANTCREALHLFPTPQQLAIATEPELRGCKLGYRAPYVMDAAQAVASGRLDLQLLGNLTDQELLEQLKTVRGVGDKVANCIALFAYGRTAMAPIDTWIRQVIDGEYDGVNPFPSYGQNAGILQQYLFYYAIHHKQELHARS